MSLDVILLMKRLHVGTKRSRARVPVAAILTDVDRSVLRCHVTDAMRRQIGSSSESSVTVGAGEGLGSGVNELMESQLCLLREPCRTDLTLERTFSAVRALVHSEVRPPHEPLPTCAARMRPHPGVGPDMLGDVPLLPEHLPADRTRERARSGVGALVVAQLPDGPEHLWTRATMERFLSAVNSSVNDQIRRPTIRLSTNFTTIWTITCIQTQLVMCRFNIWYPRSTTTTVNTHHISASSLY